MTVPTPRTDDLFEQSDHPDPPACFDREQSKRTLRSLYGYDEDVLDGKSDEWLYHARLDHLENDNRFYRA